MLVAELKKEIEKYDKKELKSIIIELYKRIPKHKKEDYDIDEFIKNINNSKTSTKKEISFEELKKEIIYFLELVDKEYYVIPNKIVSKKERSSYRFKVKKYYKELNRILPDSKNGNDATLLLIEIFKRLSKGSNILLFINWETFKGLGVAQADYYDCLMKRILFSGYTKENLNKCIDLLEVLKDPYELSYCMFEVFITNLKTNDVKEIAIKLLMNKINNLKEKYKNAKKNKNYHEEFEASINNHVICILELCLKNIEEEIGIKYFHDNYIEANEEIKEYILLDKIKSLNLKDIWLKEYESEVGKTKFRDSIVEDYKNFKLDIDK